MVIDIFTHMGSSRYLEYLSATGGTAVKRALERINKIVQETPYAVDVAKRVALLDTYGIDQQVVTLFNNIDSNAIGDDKASKVEIAGAINDSMAGIMEESRGRIVCAGSVPLEALDAGGLKEMDRAIMKLGLKAVAFPSHLNGKPLDSPEYLPFWAHAAELDVPVFIHPSNPPTPAGRPYEKGYDLTHVFGWPFETVLSLSRLVFSGIMEKYPNLKIISHHLGGGMVPFFSGRIEESYTPDQQIDHMGHALPRPPLDYFRLFYYDTAVGGSAAAVKCALEVFGPDQIVFATDFPHGPEGGLKRLETYSNIISSLKIPAADKKKILSGNAKRILKL